MYPDFQYLLQSLLGTDMPEWLSIFKTFGFLVALAFMAAAITLTSELKRKESEGLLTPSFETIEIGHPASANDLLWASLLGFFIGFKLGGIFGNAAQISPNPMGYIFSLQGNWLTGIAGALILAYSKYSEKRKHQLPQPEQKRVAVYPHQRVGEFVVIAAVGGILGAKIFNAFETWDSFVKDPIGSLLSPSGLTFYGGLIVATVALYFYSKKYSIPFKHLADAAAPGLMLAYGVGRLGCHFAGDGDWGIFNSAYITGIDGKLHLATIADFKQRLNEAAPYFTSNFGSLATTPHSFAPAPSWLPDWIYAMNYPHNVNNEGVMLNNCVGNYCYVLPVGVFPTALYEAAMGVGIFAILWAVRKKLKYGWQMFGLYLIFNGLERFFIEKARVNYKYDWGFIHPTQAEIISALLVIIGIVILVYKRKQRVAI
ncbi:MAG: diacylglyceryl transferase [Sphingobacteriales bacterium]|nr:MAG: diacylglyceryl transferase [Sphingobacteriales bacterium]